MPDQRSERLDHLLLDNWWQRVPDQRSERRDHLLLDNLWQRVPDQRSERRDQHLLLQIERLGAREYYSLMFQAGTRQLKGQSGVEGPAGVGDSLNYIFVEIF